VTRAEYNASSKLTALLELRDASEQHSSETYAEAGGAAISLGFAPEDASQAGHAAASQVDAFIKGLDRKIDLICDFLDPQDPQATCVPDTDIPF